LVPLKGVSILSLANAVTGPGAGAPLRWLLCGGVCVACTPGLAGALSPGRELPAYADHARELFDDVLEPSAVGIELDQNGGPSADLLLRERAQVGNAVVRARVTTITTRDDDTGRIWQIDFHTVDRLAGSGPLDADFAVDLGPSSPSVGIMRAFAPRLFGSTFVVFVREFAGQAAQGAAGDPDLHFHLAPDSKEEETAVRTAGRPDQVR
jgi:hypothetical protein